MTTEETQHFNKTPYFVVQANDQATPPRVVLFATRKRAVEYAVERAFHDRQVYHVFKADRQASVHPQPAKVYDEAGALATTYP